MNTTDLATIPTAPPAAPPADLDAERAIISSLLQAPTILDAYRLLLSPEMFVGEIHATIFGAICRLHDAGRPINEIIIADELRRTGALADQDVPDLLAELRDAVPSAATAPYFAGIVMDRAKCRGLLSLCHVVSRRVYSGDPAEDVLSDLQRRAGEIAERGIVDVGKQAAKLIGPACDRMMTYSGEGVAGLSTGLPELDAGIGGMRPKNLIVAAAFTKVGKTALALNIAAHLAIRCSVPSAVITFEMTADELTERLLVAEAEVPALDLRAGNITPDAREQIERTKKAIQASTLILDDAAPATISGLRTRLRMLKRLHKIQFAAIDYFQLLTGDDMKARRYDQLVQISRGLKQLANDLDMPILLLAQLNAESQSTDRTPGMGDLADCKAVCRDANVVLILDRPAERHKGSAEWLRNNAGNLTSATIDIAAIRNGSPRTIQAHYDGPLCRWRTAAQEADRRLDAAYAQRAIAFDEAEGTR